MDLAIDLMDSQATSRTVPVGVTAAMSIKDSMRTREHGPAS